MSTTTPEPVAPADDSDTAATPTTLTGRLTADPTLRTTKSGKAVTTFRIAADHPGGTTFVSVVAWGKTAQAVCDHLIKGRAVEVTGRVQQRTYTGSDGADRTVNELIARSVQFLPRRSAPASTPEVAQ